MNNIYDIGHNPCSSCGVCAVSCPSKCITISHNENGFYRPTIEEKKCTGCGICKKVCYQYLERKGPFVNYFHDKEIYGAWSKNEETQLSCTSGGVGHELINHALTMEYKVCGVVFEADIDLCKHKVVDNITDAEKFKTSKYLQSYTLEAFSQFKKDEKYLVIGTPCQIFGLRQWIQLKKKEDNFILVDFFCHGTPSHLLWKKYKQHIQDTYGLNVFNNVLFRSKENTTWHSYAMKITDDLGKFYIKTDASQEDMFFKFFLSDTCLNKSCYNCLLRLDYSASDIRLGDFWGPKYKNDKTGVTLTITNNETGSVFFNNIKNRIKFEKVQFADLTASQTTLFLKINKHYNNVITNLKSTNKPLTINNKYIKKPITNRIVQKCINILK